MEASGRRSLRATIHNSAAPKSKIANSRITSWLPAVVAPNQEAMGENDCRYAKQDDGETGGCPSA